MFKVYEGLTFGEGYDAESEHMSPFDALTALRALGTGCLMIEQDPDNHRFTVLYVKTGEIILNCLTGKIEK